MASELRRAVRSLRRAPGFLAASVLLIALAIAPTLGVFRLTDIVLLRQLSTPRPDQLVVFEKVAMDGDTGLAERQRDRACTARAGIRQLLSVFADESVSRPTTLA